MMWVLWLVVGAVAVLVLVPALALVMLLGLAIAGHWVDRWAR